MNQPAYGFLVHPRYREDFFRKFPYLRFLPNWIIDFLTYNMPPVTVSRITGLKNKNMEDIPGYIIAVPLTAVQMKKNKKRALKKIITAVKFSYKKGVRIIGFGALTSSFSHGGLKVIESFDKVGITTGHAYTIKTVVGYVLKVINEFGFNNKDVHVGIVGAGGSIGSGCARQLIRSGITHFTFIDLEKRNDILEKLSEELKQKSQKALHVDISHIINDIRDCDIIIAATNAPEVIITSDHLRPGAVIINDAQPSDISPEILTNDDVLVIEGGVIRAPRIHTNFDLGLAGSEDIFSCLAEVLVLAHNNHFENYAFGNLNEDLIKEIINKETSLNFGLSRYQNDEGYISEEKIQRVKDIIKKRLKK